MLNEDEITTQKLELRELADEFYAVTKRIKDEKTLGDAKQFMRKIERQVGEYDSKESIAREVREFVKSTKGWFRTTDIYRILQCSTKTEKKTVNQNLLRLKDENIIERHSDVNGMYRRIIYDLVEMDWKNSCPHELPLDFPLNLSQYFACYYKNIILVSGSPDAGKSAFFFEFIKRNQEKAFEIFNNPIYLFNSEMSPEEMHLRLGKREDINIEDWNFKAYMQDDNFDKVIHPNAINIIDYIELNDAFYQIGDILKAIHKKLEKGIALVGIQKGYGSTLGIGGMFGIQRARLYLTIEKGVAKIRKCKNRKVAHSMDGYMMRYKIIDGWKIIPQGIFFPESAAEFA